MAIDVIKLFPSFVRIPDRTGVSVDGKPYLEWHTVGAFFTMFLLQNDPQQFQVTRWSGDDDYQTTKITSTTPETWAHLMLKLPRRTA